MAEFDVQGQWDAQQTNNFVVHFDIKPRRPDGSFVGTASHSNGAVRGAGFGSVRDDQFLFTVTWSNGTEGAYNGAFDAQGVIRGATFDVLHPEVFAGWQSLVSFSRA
jgi:hypothetical protein